VGTIRGSDRSPVRGGTRLTQSAGGIDTSPPAFFFKAGFEELPFPRPEGSLPFSIRCVGHLRGVGFARERVSPSASKSFCETKMRCITNAVKMIAISVALSVCVSALAHSQSASGGRNPQQRPSFEVASIRPNPSSERGLTVRVANPSSRFGLESATARDIIEFAYNLQGRRLTGGPKWIDSEKFDVDAQIADSEIVDLRKLPPDQFLARLRLMVQSLLADRFALRLNHETKDLPVYALLVGKEGSKLSPSASTQPSMRNVGDGHIVATAVPLSVLVEKLAGLPELDDRIILDRTGITGSVDIDFQWTPQILYAADAGQNQSFASSDSSAPPLFEALEKQLGLKLEPTKGPVDILVIEHIEEPTPN
jgi:uncharacterized protein (TIGR03435 family)